MQRIVGKTFEFRIDDFWPAGLKGNALGQGACMGGKGPLLTGSEELTWRIDTRNSDGFGVLWGTPLFIGACEGSVLVTKVGEDSAIGYDACGCGANYEARVEQID
jgi:hypothetical protein